MTQNPPVYDYVVIGGGTAGSVIASRLTENPDVTVAVIEGGPSDVGRDDVLTLRRWMGLLGGELDYDYPTTEQPRGNSHIRHSRARVLGGCSSHNTLIAFKPLPSDWDEWEQAGAKGWGAVQMEAYYARLKNNIVPVDEKDRNAIARDFVDAARTALEVPRIESFNKKPFTEGVGFFDLAYHPENNKRSSASVAYLHPVMDERPNLTLWLETWAYRLELNGSRAEGVHVRTKDGEEVLVRARNEVVLCAGAVDSPRLLLHSGIGPRADLEALGIPVAHHLPGVGENLLDHPESVIVWETDGPIPENSAMDSDAGLFVRRDPEHAGPDLMFHFYQIPFTDNPERLGYERPESGVSMTPNIPKPKSRGRLYLTSADPEVKPALTSATSPTRTTTTAAPWWTASASPARSRRPSRSPTGSSARWPRARASPATRSSASTPARSRTPSTTRRAPAGWAPPTTTWPWSTPSCGSGACRASGSRTRPSSRP